MRRPEYASVRLSPSLKRQISQVASANSQSLSRTIELLVRRGLKQYRRDGKLIEPKVGDQAGEVGDQIDELESILRRLAPEIAKIIRKRAEAKIRPGRGEK